jgi:hypothetical protein
MQVHESQSCILIKQVAIWPTDGSFITQTIKVFLTLCTKEAMLYGEDLDIMIELLRVVEYIVSSICLSFMSRSYTSEHDALCTYRALWLIESLVVIILLVYKNSLALCINNQQDASSIQNFILSRNSTCFGHLLCPSSQVISCTRGNWYVSCIGSGHITCMKHTNCHVYSL